MTAVEERITNETVIPEVASALFSGNEDKQFAIGIVAVGNDIAPGLENEFKGYTLLRGNVYAKQKHFMPLAELNDDGTETDSDDARSVHFAVIENAMTSARVVGAMRLIVKSHEDDSPLPIEEHYPEAFIDRPAPILSTEASRLISRYENSRMQRNLKWLLFTAGVSYIKSHDLGPVYGAVETSLARGLRVEGMPVTSLSEPKFVEEFNATKMAISIDMAGLTQKIEDDRPELFSAMQSRRNDFVYVGTVPEIETGQKAAVA